MGGDVIFDELAQVVLHMDGGYDEVIGTQALHRGIIKDDATTASGLDMVATGHAGNLSTNAENDIIGVEGAGIIGIEAKAR